MHFTLVLFLVLSISGILDAASFSHSIRRAGSLREKLIKNGKYGMFLAEQNKLKSSSQPFHDFSDDQYLLDVSIGTPAVKFSLTLDTSTSFLWVLDVDCNSSDCAGDPQYGFIKTTYNRSKSSTFKNGAGNFVAEFDGQPITGDLVKDTVTVATGLTIPSQDFGSTKRVPQLYLEQPLDGVMGFGLPSQSVNSTVTPLDSLMPLLDQKLFMIWMDRKINNTHGQNGGLITYGALDTVNCDSTISYVPLNTKYYWGFNIDGFKVGGFQRQKQEQVISDTGAGWIGAPPAVISAIVKTTKATYDWNLDAYTVPCSTMNSQPDLVFTINGVDFPVKSVEYIVDLSLDNNQCVLTFFGMAASSFGPQWVLGDSFIRTYCHVYDYGNRRIGLTKAHHSF